MKWKRKFKVGDNVCWKSCLDDRLYYEKVHHEEFKDGEHKIFFTDSDGNCTSNSFMFAERVELRQEFIEKPKRKIKVKVDTCVDFKPMEVEFTATICGDSVRWRKTRSKK